MPDGRPFTRHVLSGGWKWFSCCWIVVRMPMWHLLQLECDLFMMPVFMITLILQVRRNSLNCSYLKQAWTELSSNQFYDYALFSWFSLTLRETFHFLPWWERKREWNIPIWIWIDGSWHKVVNLCVISEMLLKAGADPKLPTFSGKCPLDLSRTNVMREIINR